MRPRVGICLSRLDALISKYKLTIIIYVLSVWGVEPQTDNADAGTRRPPLGRVFPKKVGRVAFKNSYCLAYKTI